MKKRNTALPVLSALGFAACATLAANAAPIGNYQFNSPMDPEGWSFNNITGQNADGDSLNGTASGNDPQLIRAGSGLSTSNTWDTLIFRVRETQDESPAGIVDFSG